MTDGRTPTPTSSDPDRSRRPHLARRGLSAREALVSLVAVGLGLAWLGYLAVLHSDQYRSGALPPGLEASPWGFDFNAYLHASLRLIEAGSLYAPEQVALSFEPGRLDMYQYAPPFGVAMLPFTGLAFDDGVVLWWIVRVGAFGAACALMPVRPVIRALAFACVALGAAGGLDSVLGNVSLFLILPLVAAWRWMDQPAGSVGLAAAIFVRPSLVILLVWQLLRRRWRVALWTIGAGLVLFLATLPFVGLDGYRDYLAVLGNLRVPTGPLRTCDFGGLAIVLGASHGVVALARVLSTVVCRRSVVVSLRRDREISFMVTLSASLLLVPLLWNHYLATLVAARCVPRAAASHRLRPVAAVDVATSVGAPWLVMSTTLLPFFAETTD